jgi:hypothetical protein
MPEDAGLMGFDCAHHCFLSDYLVLEEAFAKLCWLLPSCGTVSRSMVKSVSGENAHDLWICLVIRVSHELQNGLLLKFHDVS